MNPVFATLFLLAVTTFASPIPSNHVTHKHLPLASGKHFINAASKIKSKKVDLVAPVNPFRYQMPVATKLSSKSVDSNQVLLKSSAPAVANAEKNWLLTKAWLIDNINRLRTELSSLQLDYSSHLDTVERTNSEKEKQFIEDIAKLRADHTVLSQQQKQIIYLIKRNQVLRGKPVSENDIHYSPSGAKASGKSVKVFDGQIKRQIKRDLTQTMRGENFEIETRRNMKELFAELSSLHDITLTLFDNFQSVQRKMENRDKFK